MGRKTWIKLMRILLMIGGIWLLVIVGLAGAVLVISQHDQAQTADVIIVLGSGLRRDNSPGPALVRRSRHAAALYAAGYAPVVICTGGRTAGRTRSEADGCREVLEANGVAPSAIYLDENSRSTEENAYYTRPIMTANGWTTAILVSDGYHLLRAWWLFAQEGLTVYPSPVVGDLGRLTLARAVVREIAALHWHVFKNALNLPVTYLPNV